MKTKMLFLPLLLISSTLFASERQEQKLKPKTNVRYGSQLAMGQSMPFQREATPTDSDNQTLKYLLGYSPEIMKMAMRSE